MNDFLDNLGAQQHEKLIEKNASNLSVKRF